MGGDPGVDRADDQRDDIGVLRRQFGPDAGAERTAGEFRRAVAAHARHRDDPRRRQHIDDGAFLMLGQHRGKGPAHRQRAEIIALHLGPRGVEVGRAHQGGHAEDPGVVDHQADIVAGLGGGLDLIVPGYVEGDGDGLAGEFGLKVRGIGRIAAADIDLGRPRRQQPPHEGLADPAVATGDQAHAALDIHCCSLLDDQATLTPLSARAQSPRSRSTSAAIVVRGWRVVG